MYRVEGFYHLFFFVYLDPINAIGRPAWEKYLFVFSIILGKLSFCKSYHFGKAIILYFLLFCKSYHFAIRTASGRGTFFIFLKVIFSYFAIFLKVIFSYFAIFLKVIFSYFPIFLKVIFLISPFS